MDFVFSYIKASIQSIIIIGKKLYRSRCAAAKTMDDRKMPMTTPKLFLNAGYKKPRKYTSSHNGAITAVTTMRILPETLPLATSSSIFDAGASIPKTFCSIIT